MKKGPPIDKNVNLHVWGDFKILRTKITLKLKFFLQPTLYFGGTFFTLQFSFLKIFYLLQIVFLSGPYANPNMRHV